MRLYLLASAVALLSALWAKLNVGTSAPEGWFLDDAVRIKREANPTTMKVRRVNRTLG